jgi:hypothetical protein
MGTKSNRSSGTQYNPKGATQGNTLVDPNTGLPISVIEDSEGNRRLAVDAQVTAQIGQVNVDLDFNEDSVYLGDPNSGATLKINPDGSIDTNTSIDAIAGDNIAIKDPISGNDLKINPDGSLDTNIISTVLPTDAATESKQDILISEIQDLSNQLPSTLGEKTKSESLSVVLATDQPTLPVSLINEPLNISGTDDGTNTGNKFVFVNNRLQQILKSEDRQSTIIYLDFGTKNQRISQITYTSPKIGVGPGFTAVKTFNYTLVGNRYRRDDVGNWSLV